MGRSGSLGDECFYGLGSKWRPGCSNSHDDFAFRIAIFAEDIDPNNPPPNSPATGVPAITGTPQVDETLTADTSGISDDDGLRHAHYAHQWLADDADIDGATGFTYTPTVGDEGKAIKVRVTFIDDAGNEESLTSAATEPVARAALRPQSATVARGHPGPGLQPYPGRGRLGAHQRLHRHRGRRGPDRRRGLAVGLDRNPDPGLGGGPW